MWRTSLSLKHTKARAIYTVSGVLVPFCSATVSTDELIDLRLDTRKSDHWGPRVLLVNIEVYASCILGTNNALVRCSRERVVGKGNTRTRHR